MKLSPIEKEKRDYIKRHFEKFYQYIEGVTNGSILTNEYIKLAVKRYQILESTNIYDFRKDKIEKFLRFTFYVNIDVNNQYCQFELLPHQCFYFFNIYGWYLKGKQERLYRNSAYLCGRKQGKTTISCVSLLYGLAMDDFIDSQLYLVSSTVTMASTTGYQYLKNIINNSPALKKRIEQKQYSLNYSQGTTTNRLKVLVNDPDSANAIRPVQTVLDETHLMKEGTLFEKIQTANAYITNSLTSIISTRGHNITNWQFEHEKYLIDILNGTVINDRYFVMIFCLDSMEEVTNFDCYIKANPNLIDPNVIKIESLIELYEQSKLYNLSRRTFIIDMCNLWVMQEKDTEWLTTELLDNSFSNKINIAEFKGCEAFLSVDMSTIKDITSLNCLINKDGTFYSFNWHWIANDDSKLLRRNGYDLAKYVGTGELIISRSNKAINYREIFEKIEELSEFLNVVVFGHDNHNTVQLAFDVENELRIDCEFVQQGYALSNAIQYLEFLMNENQYKFNNALTKWMFGNVYIQVGVVKGDWQIVKGKSKDAIDGIIAMCNNLHLHIKYRTDSDSVIIKNQLERLRAEQSAKS